MYTGTLDPVSNRATWIVNYEITDVETGDLIDLSGVDEITIEIRDPKTQSAILTGTKTGGDIVISDTGVFTWTFSATDMRTLCAKTYEVGCTLTDNSETVQLMIGTLPVYDGVVS